MNQKLAELKRVVVETIDGMRGQLEELALRIHAHPETKFEEERAAGWLCEAAQAAGFQVERPLAGLPTAFRASFRGGEGPRVAFLAEYDALPELGHACGHNLIGAASLGAALGIALGLREFPGTVELIGTPGEEGGGGKVILAQAGVFNGLAAVMLFHPSSRTILWKYALARRKLLIEFFGKAAHASGSPDKGINALDAVLQTFNSINALRQHLPDDVRIHGVITDGGAAPNIVPDHAAALFYVRALDDGYCDQVLERVMDCARGAALATGAKANLEVQGAYRSLRTNLPLAQAFKENLESLGWEFDQVDPKERLGSTDMGDVSHVAPAIHPYLAIGPAELAGHSIEFREAAASEQGLAAMLAAAKALAMTALDVLFRPELREEIQAAFTGG
ncbi:M20 family metallopeptidase [Candidatus Bipolaricaulota bacterium]|nr:M20 family metallopeptidase [Candidatus Bipolaricaulota bacterium]